MLSQWKITHHLKKNNKLNRINAALFRENNKLNMLIYLY